MTLADWRIKDLVQSGDIGINPYNERDVQPASYDFHLGNVFKVWLPSRYEPIDPRTPPEMQSVAMMTNRHPYVLEPLGFCLASSVEWFEFPDWIGGRLEGKSSLGRLGLTAHVTAGFFDPGFRGHATLELFNANRTRAIFLYPDMKIGQMSFFCIDGGSVERPYGSEGLRSKYQNQGADPAESQMHRNFLTD